MRYQVALALAAVVALWVLAERWLIPLGHHVGEELPSFYFRGLFAVVGVAGSLALTAVAKGLAKSLLERHEEEHE